MCIWSARLTAGNETWRRWLDIRVLVFVVRSPTCARPLLAPPLSRSVCLRVPFSVAVGHRRDRRPRTLARSAPRPVPDSSAAIATYLANVRSLEGSRDGERGATDSLRRFISTTRHFPASLTAERLRSLFGPTDEGVQFTEQTQILLWGQILSQRSSDTAFLRIASGGQY